MSLLLLFSGAVLPTVGRPASDVTTGAWVPSTGVSLFDVINEVVPDDGDYISTTTAAPCTMTLESTLFPGSASQQKINYRASSTQGSNLTVRMFQGATTIMTRTHALTGINTLYTQSLTSPEIALITAGAISIELTAT